MPARDFSKRYGFQARPAEMVRDDSPEALRLFVLRLVSERARSSIHTARTIVSDALAYAADPSNQSVSEIWQEIQHAIRTCPWFLIYDLIEELWRNIRWSSDDQNAFVDKVNEFFDEQNIGWQLKIVPTDLEGLPAPQIVIRGNDEFERIIERAERALEASLKNTARAELREAVQDLSRRPQPDLTGAIQHAIAALECVAKEICREPGETLGQITKKHPGRFPAPLGDAVAKLYGFASDRGRHVTEGKSPSQKEAELTVSVSGALMAFLLD
jgi:hypothetical protein